MEKRFGFWTFNIIIVLSVKKKKKSQTIVQIYFISISVLLFTRSTYMLINVAYVVHVTNNANSNSLPSRLTNILNRLYLLHGCCVRSADRSLMVSSSDTLLIIQPHWIRWISRRSLNATPEGYHRPALVPTNLDFLNTSTQTQQTGPSVSVGHCRRLNDDNSEQSELPS